MGWRVDPLRVLLKGLHWGRRVPLFGLCRQTGFWPGLPMGRVAGLVVLRQHREPVRGVEAVAC